MVHTVAMPPTVSTPDPPAVAHAGTLAAVILVAAVLLVIAFVCLVIGFLSTADLVDVTGAATTGQ